MRSNEALATVRPGASSMAFPPPQLSVHSSLLTLLSMPSAAALSIRMMSSLHCSNRRDMSSRNPGSPPSCHAASVGSRQSGISVPDVEYIPVRNRSVAAELQLFGMRLDVLCECVNGRTQAFGHFP